ncbi:hypothetical protein GALMADRAFT_213446 [Galerina marginata CBS 339.88]|uniref:Uncharacterized protein n=1 Tax=Galerina marginata (strain CBS 339.88) TaxID=685588 RepID=A0A067SPM7_GALM3|nr:hypothetical protein GALMADRAFT_213446 [Galerina marginata CBS 339.88]
MSTDKLLYNESYWKKVLEENIQKISLNEKLHLIFRCIAQLLQFIFTSQIKEVRSRAARFLGHTHTTTSEDKAFPAGMIFRAWLKNFPKARKNPRKMIEPCTVKMVLEESDKLIGDKELQVTLKNLTLQSIKKLLEPKTILEKYHALAPFTWNLLETISASPNKHRKYNIKTDNFEDDKEERNDWDDDPNGDDEEPERKWDDLKTPWGFLQNPTSANTFWPSSSLRLSSPG